MDRTNIYEYDRKNRKSIVSAIEQMNGMIVSWSYFVKEQDHFSFPAETSSIFVDLSSLF